MINPAGSPDNWMPATSPKGLVEQFHFAGPAKWSEEGYKSQVFKILFTLFFLSVGKVNIPSSCTEIFLLNITTENRSWDDIMMSPGAN